MGGLVSTHPPRHFHILLIVLIHLPSHHVDGAKQAACQTFGDESPVTHVLGQLQFPTRADIRHAVSSEKVTAFHGSEIITLGMYIAVFPTDGCSVGIYLRAAP